MKKLFWIVVASLAFSTFAVSCDDEDEFKGDGNNGDNTEIPNDTVPQTPDDTIPENPQDSTVDMLDVTFALKCSDVTATSVKLQVKPSDDKVGYYFDICTEEDYNKNQGNIKHIIELYLNHVMMHNPDVPFKDLMKDILSWGPDEDVITRLPMGTKFYFYAVAVNEKGQICSEISKTTFQTKEKGNPADCTFKFEFSSLTSASVHVTVKPSDETIPYFMFLIPKNEFPGDYGLMAAVQQNFMDFAREQDVPLEEVVKQVTLIGEHQESFTDLASNTAYYVYAFPINEKGESEGELSKQMFTTVDTGMSDAAITLSYKYFDGNELAESDPTAYGKMKGKVYVQAVITPNSSAEHWLIALAKGDLSDPKTYPDEANKDALAHGGKKDITNLNFVVNGWETCTFLYFAIDEMGIDGVLSRDVVTFTKENASPISEVTKAPAQRASLMKVAASAAPENRLIQHLENSFKMAADSWAGYRMK